MNDLAQVNGRGGLHWFTLLKYLTYALLCSNVCVFLAEDLAAMEHTSGGSITASDQLLTAVGESHEA